MVQLHQEIQSNQGPKRQKKNDLFLVSIFFIKTSNRRRLFKGTCDIYFRKNNKFTIYLLNFISYVI